MRQSPRPADVHWHSNQRLTGLLLATWFAASFISTFFARELNAGWFGWPLGFWIAAQGAPVLYVLLVSLYAWRMRRRDARLAASEAAADAAAEPTRQVARRA